MFGNPIVRDRFSEAKAPSQNENGGQDGDSDYDNSDTSMVAEQESTHKIIKPKKLATPDEYDDAGLPPMVREAKKEIREKRKEELANAWWPDKDLDSDQKYDNEDVIQKSEKLEAGQDYAAN